jgi:hypothetical protein
MATEAVTLPPQIDNRKRKLTPEQRAELLRILTEQPELSDSQLAHQFNVSRVLVWKLRKTVQPISTAEPLTADRMRDELERLIGQRLPPERIVAELADLITDRKTPKSVKLMALKLATEHGGVVTRKEQRDAEANKIPAVGIFVLPAGSAPAASLDLPAVVVRPTLEIPAVTSASPGTDKSTS